MNFSDPLLRGILLRRYKRFLCDIRLDDGREIVAVTPNTGSMKGVLIPGAPVLVSESKSLTRKIPFTWEMIFIEGAWVGVNTHLPNLLVAEALEKRIIPGLKQYREYRREVRLASGSRLDFALGNDESALIEVKNVTLVENGVALFPDSVTERGTRHLHELMEAVKHGKRAYMLFVCQHHQAKWVSPADSIDPVYGRTLRKAANAGVKLLAMKARVTPSIIELDSLLPVVL
ncbi:DNA/RNA nuclease SfsA [bacterium]|nr:DNA/RNA nuclease SfsA [bacterium]